MIVDISRGPLGTDYLAEELLSLGGPDSSSEHSDSAYACAAARPMNDTFTIRLQNPLATMTAFLRCCGSRTIGEGDRGKVEVGDKGAGSVGTMHGYGPSWSVHAELGCTARRRSLDEAGDLEGE